MFWTCRDLSGDIEWNSISVRLWVNTILLSCDFDLVCWTLHEKKMRRHVTADSTSVDISSSFCIPFPPLRSWRGALQSSGLLEVSTHWGFFSRPLLLCACSRGISWFSLWWCKAPRDAFECDLAFEVDEVIGCFERSSVMKWWLHSIYGQIRWFGDIPWGGRYGTQPQ